MEQLNISLAVASLGLFLNLLGIAFAPITTHFTERLGQPTVYLISIHTFSLFILGSSQSKTFVSLAVRRFFAGFFGGPCLVLIEGTCLLLPIKVIIQNQAKRNKSIDEDGEETKVTMEALEYRLVPVMIGAVLMTTSLFWIGWTGRLDGSGRQG